MTETERYNELLQDLTKAVKNGGAIGKEQINSLIEKLSRNERVNE